MRLLSLLCLTFVILLGFSFAILNSDLVTIHYYVGVKQMPLSILMLGVLVLGIIIGWIVSFAALLKCKMAIRYNRDRG
jgi:putative membrane protein